MPNVVLMGVNSNGKEVPVGVDSTGAIKMSGGGGSGTVSSDDITDATTVGKNLIKAADAAAARTAIGAGTSSLAIGTTASTAAAGNHTHGAATTSAAGFMSAADKTKLDSSVDATGAVAALKAKTQIAALTPIADTAGADAAAVAVLLNQVIAALKA